MIRLYNIIFFCSILCFQIGSLCAWTYNPFQPKLPERPTGKTVPHKKKIKPKKQRSPLPRFVPSTNNRDHRRGNIQKKSYKRQPVRRQKTSKPTPPRSPSLPSLKITGVVWNCERPQAIINDTVVGIGDVIANTEIRIVDIRKDAIDLMFAGKKMTIAP